MKKVHIFILSDRIKKMGHKINTSGLIRVCVCVCVCVWYIHSITAAKAQKELQHVKGGD